MSQQFSNAAIVFPFSSFHTLPSSLCLRSTTLLQFHCIDDNLLAGWHALLLQRPHRACRCARLSGALFSLSDVALRSRLVSRHQRRRLIGVDGQSSSDGQVVAFLLLLLESLRCLRRIYFLSFSRQRVCYLLTHNRLSCDSPNSGMYSQSIACPSAARDVFKRSL